MTTFFERSRSIERGVMVLGFVAAVAGCAADPNHAARQAAQPAQIALAVCAGQHRRDMAACDSPRLPHPASEIAYATCLTYTQRDQTPCAGLRHAYEADLHKYFAGSGPTAIAAIAMPADAQPYRGARQWRQYAERLYPATSRDAQTFEAALLIPDIRKKVERVLGQRLSDNRLRALTAQADAEARYWYKYMQGLAGPATANPRG